MRLTPTTATLITIFAPLISAAATLPMSSANDAWRTQQILLEPQLPYRPTAPSNKVHQYLDAEPNTVGILFMNTADEGVHVWLPLGERVTVGSSEVIPSHPLTARITGMVGATSERARREVLEQIECRVYLRRSGDSSTVEPAIKFSRKDDLVRIGAKGGLFRGRNDREVESYECA